MKRNRFAKKVRNAICIVGGLMFGFAGCTGGGEDSTVIDATAEIWTATGTEKILRDLDYSSRYAEDTLEIGAFRNESESAQIIVTPDADTSYTIETSDLTNKEGEILSKDCISVYHQLYINVTTVKEKICTTGAGYYPDALLPYQNAISNKVNEIVAGRNQGIWITVKPSKTQTAGEYTGNFKITACGKEYSVPVRVTVYDYTLGDETHIKTKFNMSDTDIGIAELDTSYEMSQAYYEFLLDHRISATYLPYGKQWLADMDLYMSNVLKYTLDPRCSQVPIMFTGGTDLIEITADGVLAIDEARGQEGNTKELYNTVYWSWLQNLLMRFAEDSFKNDINLFQKAELYLTIIDEYDSAGGNKGPNKAVYNLRRYEDLANRVADVFESMEWTEDGIKCTKTLEFDKENENAGVGYKLVDIDSPVIYECSLSSERFEELIEEMSTDLRAIRNTTTATSVTDFYYEYTNAGFCPTIDYYGSEGNREHAKAYAEKSGGEMWTYTAVNPQNPYPTYHIEDVLISSRLLGWMMYDYDIAGNLYWETQLYRYTANWDQVFDYYNEPLRFSGANGDGYLTYPGRPYGIYGPVGSIRLQSTRDCNEDYDLMYELEEFYADRGISGDDFDTVLNFLVDGLYSGTSCNYDGDYLTRFAQKRELLAELLSFTSNTGAIVESIKTTSGVTKIKLSAPSSVVLKSNGSKLTGKASDKYYALNGTQETCYEYTVEIPLSQASNVAKFTAEISGKSYEVSFDLGGKTVTTSASTLLNAITVTSNTTHENDAVLDMVDGLEVVKMNVAYADLMQIDLDVTSLNIDSSASKFVLNIYNYGEAVELTVKGKAKNSRAYVTTTTVVIPQGWVEVTIDLTDFKLAQNGNLEYIRLALANENSATSDISIALKEIMVQGGAQ